MRLVLNYIIGLILVLAPISAYAQGSLYVAPASGTYKVGELFSVLIKVDTGNRAVNAAAAQINFDHTRLEVDSLGYSKSLFNLWTEEPSYSNALGYIKFSGGLPSPGYDGSGAAILRVTFRPKETGQASMVFNTGSLLANDGYGTNILDELTGGFYEIIPAILPIPTRPPTKEDKKIEQVEKTLTPPIITDYPSQIEEGSTLFVRGLGFPNSQVLVYFQNNNDAIVIEESAAGIDGRFFLTQKKKIFGGTLRIWSKNILSDGTVSGDSETIIIEVTRPFFLRIGSIAIEYMTVFLILLALLLLAIVIIVWLWMRIRVWQDKKGGKISEAERSLHHGFDKLKEGIIHYFNYIVSGKTPEDMKKRERKVLEDFEKKLNKVREDIEEEMENVRKK